MSNTRNTCLTAGLLLLLLPGLLQAQGSSTVRGVAGATLGFSRLANSTQPLVGGWAGLAFGESFVVGGFGLGMPGVVELEGGGLLQELRFGYGGLMIDFRPPAKGPILVGGRILLGAGNAQLRAQPIGNQIGSDNFIVIEPQALAEMPRNSLVRGTITAGYRLVLGVQDLPGLDKSDLTSWSVMFSVTIGGGS